ncbi:MAG: AbrB/MazE/SpoVT family DNA-binding domain-containing protein [Sphingomonadaceae bacterium]|nr:AbrB/MazE/SpoVT family DNA-binding domain-containing protein [Sphingomonadaceae bacterium]
MTYMAKVINGGKVVLPADLRRELGLETGDHVIFEQTENGVVMKTHAQVIREIQDQLRPFKRPGASEVDALIAERRAENAKEEAEVAEMLARRAK